MRGLYLNKGKLWTAFLIGLCFMLTSTGYLVWTYHIMALTKAPLSETITLIAGYLMQAAGIFLFSCMTRQREDLIRNTLYIVLALHMLCLFPAVLGSSLIQAVIFGLLLNLLCGWIAGYYLQRLSSRANAASAAVILGNGYAGAIVLTWLLSVIGNGAVWHSYGILIICLILTGAVGITARMLPAAEKTDSKDENCVFNLEPAKDIPLRKFFFLIGSLVLLLSIVNSCGFGFPSGDLKSGVNLEFSRLFYAAGLMIAGIVHDKNRRYGAFCAMAALAVPFFMLAIREEPVSMMIFWALSYFTFGFYTVYRIILLCDIAREKKMLWVAGMGLMIGRVGDAAGEALCLMLSDKYLILAGITAILFMVSLFLFFRVYQLLYLPEAKKSRSEREIFNHFSARHDLSGREREVLRFLLQEKTNQEIAEALSISEGTVKYHIHNLLQKTSCRNRLELLAAYAAEQNA